MIYNSFGESFYVKGLDIPFTTGFIVATWPWFMPLLFTLSGISSFFALKKRTPREYINERIDKLLTPLASGILLLVPAQTFFAERFHNGYTGSYLYQYFLFFTKPTDFTGYNGGFTPAHLWFILYLFVLSMLALPIIFFFNKTNKNIPTEKLNIPTLLLLFILPLLGSFILDISGKSLGEYLAYFLLGYFVLCDEGVLAKLEKWRLRLIGLSLVNMLTILLWWQGLFSFVPPSIYSIFSRFYAWVMILALIGVSRYSLNFTNKVTHYLSAFSFPAYVFHQSWLVAVAYFIVPSFLSIPSQMLLIIFISFLLTYATYELCRRIPLARALFGIKP
jgi:hypothetical protein